jgi:CheY-like chemotaxis protein
VTRAVETQNGSGTTASGPGSGPKVLIIDDVAEARELYSAYLEYHGFRVETAEDGVAGLTKARETRPDAIVLDYSMPRMDGEQVLACLHDSEDTRAIPVLMLTAVPDLVSRRTRRGCTAFLEKPCEPDRLVGALSAAIRARQT